MKYLDNYTIAGFEQASKAKTLNDDLAQFLQEGGIQVIQKSAEPDNEESKNGYNFDYDHSYS